MKFSDLVVLGSTTVEFDATVFLADQCGCLIGMAAFAQTGANSMTSHEIWELFPWLKAETVAICPECRTFFHTYAASISCLAAHVELKEVSFESALSYIRSVEPAENGDFSETLNVKERGVREHKPV